jgi:hypothetical protein
MALAIRFEQLLRDGVVKGQAELARLGRVSRARLTQIMNLLNLAPDIQEEILFLPRTEKGVDPVGERDLRPIAAVADWRKQRRMWRSLRAGDRILCTATGLATRLQGPAAARDGPKAALSKSP